MTQRLLCKGAHDPVAHVQRGHDPVAPLQRGMTQWLLYKGARPSGSSAKGHMTQWLLYKGSMTQLATFGVNPYGVMPQLDFLVSCTNVGHSTFGYRKVIKKIHVI